MLVVFNIVNILCFFEIVFGECKKRCHVVGFILASLAMLYLHYTGFVFFSAEVLLYGILWVSGQTKGSVRDAVIIFGIPLLLYLPWMGVMYANLVDAPRDWAVSRVPTPAEVYNTMHRLFGPADNVMRFHLWVFVAVLSLLAIDTLKKKPTQSIVVLWSLVFLMVVPILAFYIESLVGTPIFEKRYFITAIVIEALLVAWVIYSAIAMLPDRLRNALTVLAIVAFSVWTVKANIKYGIYTNKDKDPVREAVAMVKDDITKNKENDYIVAMTHNWFEPYIRTMHIQYDADWFGRRYYISQQFGDFSKYIAKHKDKTVLYYLALREPNAQSALVALKQEYKLLSQSTASIEAGDIDVFKFSLVENPDSKQLAEAGTNPSNEIAKILAKNIADKPKETYRILMTHKWVVPYLERNAIELNEAWDSSYVINAQADQVFSEIAKHPEITTLYYLALEEPNAEGAIFLLQTRYKLVDEQSVQTAVGKMNVLQFNVKESAVVDDKVLERMHASKTDQVSAWIKDDIQQQSATQYAVAMANDWVEPYLKFNGIAIDGSWQDRKYYSSVDANKIFEYLTQHPSFSIFYYVALHDVNTERAALILQAKYRLLDHAEIDVAAGKIDIYKYDTKSRAEDMSAVRDQLADSPIDNLVTALAKDSAYAAPSKAVVLMTHQWFQPYLYLHDIAVDKSWPSRFFSQPSQMSDLTAYLKQHPEIEHVYYLGLAEPNLQLALDALKKNMATGCKKFVQSPLGTLKLLRFDAKMPPDSEKHKAVTCGE
jgi:hypothetical protein